MKIYKPLNIKNLSWPQAKVRFPLMKPLGDADKDGLKNKFDCKPFDRRRQGKEHEIICNKCGKKIDPLEVFPGGICVDCHEEMFDRELERTGILPKPDFKNIF